jgi:hypothetical protein
MAYIAETEGQNEEGRDRGLIHVKRDGGKQTEGENEEGRDRGEE